MRIFLDTSVILSACGSDRGASREIFVLAPDHDWALIVTPYVIKEVLRNLDTMPNVGEQAWPQLQMLLITHRNVLTLDRPTSFSTTKDRPILFGALAWADVLLTIDKGDFGDLMGGEFYGLQVLKPGDFLKRERSLGRL